MNTQRCWQGRNIDEVLFDEVKEAYAKIPLTEDYITTPEYQQYGRPYSEIFMLMSQVYSIYDKFDIKALLNLQAEDMKDFYRIRHEIENWKINTLNISDKSKEKLITLDSEIKTPWVFDNTGSYQKFFVMINSMGLFIAFALAVCLSPTFAGEYSTGTDQIILSSKFGKNKLIYAKIFTAVSFSAVLFLIITVLTYLASAAIFGFGGSNAPFQLFVPPVNVSFQSWVHPATIFPFTMLQAAVIFSLSVLFGVLLTSTVTLLLSSIFKSPFGVIIIVSLLLFVPAFFNITQETEIYNVLRLFPVGMMGMGSVISYIPYEVLGLPIMSYVFMPVFAAIGSVMILPFVRWAFKNHQIR